MTPDCVGAAARAAVKHGRFLETQHRCLEAADCYERVWKLRDSHPAADEYAAHAAHNLGWLRSQMGRRTDALECYDRAYTLRNAGPSAVEPAYLAALARGRLHARDGDDLAASCWFGRALLDGDGWHSNGMQRNDPPLQLTPDQQARLSAAALEWFERLGPARSEDRPRAEQAIGRLYEIARRSPPRFVWCASPAACHESLAALRSSIGTPLTCDLLMREWFDYSWHVRSQLGSSLHGSSVWGMSRHLGYGLSLQPGGATMPARRDEFPSEHRGRADASLLLAPVFCRDALDVRYPEPLSETLDCWSNATRAVDLWIPFDSVCVASPVS